MALPESPHPVTADWTDTYTYPLFTGDYLAITFDALTDMGASSYLQIYDSYGYEIDGSPFFATDLAGVTVYTTGASFTLTLTYGGINSYGVKVDSVVQNSGILLLDTTSLPNKLWGFAASIFLDIPVGAVRPFTWSVVGATVPADAWTLTNTARSGTAVLSTYYYGGPFSIELRVTDNVGKTATETFTFSINSPTAGFTIYPVDGAATSVFHFLNWQTLAGHNCGYPVSAGGTGGVWSSQMKMMAFKPDGTIYFVTTTMAAPAPTKAYVRITSSRPNDRLTWNTDSFFESKVCIGGTQPVGGTTGFNQTLCAWDYIPATDTFYFVVQDFADRQTWADGANPVFEDASAVGQLPAPTDSQYAHYFNPPCHIWKYVPSTQTLTSVPVPWPVTSQADCASAFWLVNNTGASASPGFNIFYNAAGTHFLIFWGNLTFSTYAYGGTTSTRGMDTMRTYYWSSVTSAAPAVVFPTGRITLNVTAPDLMVSPTQTIDIDVMRHGIKDSDDLVYIFSHTGAFDGGVQDTLWTASGQRLWYLTVFDINTGTHATPFYIAIDGQDVGMPIVYTRGGNKYISFWSYRTVLAAGVFDHNVGEVHTCQVTGTALTYLGKQDVYTFTQQYDFNGTSIWGELSGCPRLTYDAASGTLYLWVAYNPQVGPAYGSGTINYYTQTTTGGAWSVATDLGPDLAPTSMTPAPSSWPNYTNTPVVDQSGANMTPLDPTTYALSFSDNYAPASRYDFTFGIGAVNFAGPAGPSITCGSPPTATVGIPYSHTFPVSGGTPPYTFAITSGSLPPGLTLDTSTGVVSGTPSGPAAGTYSFTIQVTDSLGATATVTCGITVAVNNTVQPMRLTYLDQSIYFDYTDTVGNPVCLRYEIPKKRWFAHYYADGIVTHYLTESAVSGPDTMDMLMPSRSRSMIYKGGGNTDNGADINTLVQTGFSDGGDERAQKLYVDYMIDAEGVGTINTACFYDNNNSASAIFSVSPAGTRLQYLTYLHSLSDLSLHRNISVKFDWIGGPDGPKMYAWEPSGFIQPYLCVFFVTQFIQFSFPGWKHMRRAFPALISTANVLFTVKTQDGRTFGPYTIPSTGGQYKIQPQMLDQNIKDLSFALQLDGQGTPFAFFIDDFHVEVKEWSEDTYIKLAVLKA